jgi:hypothetical protein
MAGKWGKWIANKCTRTFVSPEGAVQYLREHDYSGKILQTPEGILAVCCAYPDGYYPEATTLFEICDDDSKNADNSSSDCCDKELLSV